MTPNNTKAIVEAHPKLFSKEKSIWCGDGWFTLIYNTSKVIENIINDLPVELQPSLHVSQIKEKFGTLRFYMAQEVPKITGVIDLAEEMSGYICEKCGHPGATVNNGGWLTTLCTAHYEERQKK